MEEPFTIENWKNRNQWFDIDKESPASGRLLDMIVKDSKGDLYEVSGAWTRLGFKSREEIAWETVVLWKYARTR